MNIKAINRVDADMRAIENRRRVAAAEAERLAQIRAEKAEQKAEEERIERERPFNEEVARRLAEYKSK
ncbi:hypothetical protein [Sporosarcina newyorkensis]|uniref:Uncharacterized protein n=1 Tax=Sporosarcina newyorkensis TaxID=759851 RepID=A0A1T4XGR3_9BACL|nr:hypothetical protein [Sporosarcina newyorkensis]SKA88730.1 hypothetical protein SAMN04244570_0731 [Sporosarcina newyorkensis]